MHARFLMYIFHVDILDRRVDGLQTLRCPYRVTKVQRHYETKRKRRKEAEEESRQISQNNAILVSGRTGKEGGRREREEFRGTASLFSPPLLMRTTDARARCRFKFRFCLPSAIDCAFSLMR